VIDFFNMLMQLYGDKVPDYYDVLVFEIHHDKFNGDLHLHLRLGSYGVDRHVSLIEVNLTSDPCRLARRTFNSMWSLVEREYETPRQGEGLS